MTNHVTEINCPYCGHPELEVTMFRTSVFLACDKCEVTFPSGKDFTDACHIVEGISMTAEAMGLIVR